VTSEDEFDVDEINVNFLCFALTSKTETETSISFSSDGIEIDREPDTKHSLTVLWSSRITVSSALHITSGYKQEFHFSIKLPENYPKTDKTIRKIKWFLRGVMKAKKRPDVKSKQIYFTVIGSASAS
jgi:hypothetical protein